MTFNAHLGMAQCYYVATASPSQAFPRLDGEIEADVAVIGGGCTGLSAALHAAERGMRVVLLEGGKIGWGASGRNGGQMIPGLRKGAVELIHSFGERRARALFDLALEARALVLSLIDKHAIACDLRLTGHLVGAVRQKDARQLAEEVETLQRVMRYPHAEFLSAAQTRAEVDTPYHGGLLDRLGGHMHPLNYTLGLARAAKAAGVQIHENSPAIDLEQDGRVVVRTEQGQVRAQHAVLAGDALLHGLERRVNSRIMPVANYVVATEPLPDAQRLIPNDVAVSDSRFVVNYYRLTADSRLLFGGGERYTTRPPADIEHFVRPYMEAVFPQLSGRRVDYAWGGLVSITTTRLPHVGRRGPVYYAHGYSGMGVILSTLAGKLLADALAGDDGGFQQFADIEPPPFPGGTRLRGPLHVIGMLWYALRDRI